MYLFFKNIFIKLKLFSEYQFVEKKDVNKKCLGQFDVKLIFRQKSILNMSLIMNIL